mgnify:CR=1 FL=1
MSDTGAQGYGRVTKTLHWLTVAALIAQFAIGLTMSTDNPQRERIDAFEDMIEAQGEAAERLFEDEIDRLRDAAGDDGLSALFAEPGLSLPEVHVLLGLSILLLATLRVLWRRLTPLPPWAEHLSPGERRLEGVLEQALLTLLFVVPASGLVLLALGDDWLALHLAAQLVLLAAVAIHVGLVLRHTLIHRNGHLARML